MITYADINRKTEKQMVNLAEDTGFSSDSTMTVLYLKLISDRLANIADELHALNKRTEE